MKYRWALTESAEREILLQTDWYLNEIPEGSAELANRWNSRLQKALEGLTSNPERHGFAPENGQWMPQLVIRQMVFRPWKSGAGWRVLFTVDEKAQVVTVLQLRHEHRRYLHERGEAETE